MGAIEIRNVGKTFLRRRGGEVVALENVSLAIRPSEFVCLLGPSGCGKSTLLNMIAGFEKPTRGEILVGGVPIRGPGTNRTVIFQDVQRSLFPWLTVRDNVEFGLRMRGVPTSERRAVSARHLELVGLQEQAEQMPFELSGGMKQRVQLARALANDPEILLMDEPFGSLDAQTRAMLQVELEAIWEGTRKTVVFVTHDIQEAIRLADRIVVMSAGPRARVLRVIPVDLPRPRSLAMPEVDALAQTIEALIQPVLAQRRRPVAAPA
jgi:NitT/TauT family transport system ATP-binding protein